MQRPLTVLVLGALLFPLLAWISAVGDPRELLSAQVPPGQLLYACSKLAGLASVTLVGLQLFLIVAERRGSRLALPSWSMKQHRLLGIATAVVIGMHVLLFAGAASRRTGRIAWELLLPKFQEGSYDRGLGLGAVALWLIAIAIPAGAFRYAGRGGRAVARVHRLVALAFALALAHGLWIGSEKALLALIAGFAGLLLLVGALAAPRPS